MELKQVRIDLAEQQISRLIREVKAARRLIREQNAQIESIEAQLSAEQKNSTSFSASYEAALRELDSLRNAILSLRETIEAKNETIAALTRQRDKERARARKANKRAVLATIGAAAVLVLRFLK